MDFAFLETARKIDILKGLQTPTPSDVQQLQDLLSNPENERYFFANLQNPGWFSYVREMGFLDNPPEPVKIEAGSYQIPVWNASRYLARMAKQFPNEVADIAIRYKTTNAWVIHDLLVAAKEMPAQVVAKMTPALINWLDVPFEIQAGSLAAELMILLSEGGQINSAMQLLEALIEPKLESSKGEQLSQFPRAVSRFRDYELRNVLLIQVPKVVEQTPVQALAILEKQLEKALDLEVQANHISKESSVFWRSAIEDSDQNWQHGDLKSLLTSAVRGTLAVLSRGNLDGGETVNRYLSHKYSIFRRLAIHTVRVFPDQYHNQLLGLFQAKENLRDLTIHHEFLVLVRTCYPRLPGETQTQFLEWIEEGPDLEDFQKGFTISRGRPATEQELDERKNYWIFERLWLLRDSKLPQSYADQLARLHEKFSDPEHPEFLTYHTSSFGGPSSPINEDPLAAMTIEELVRNFLEFKGETERLEPSPEGLARVFQSVVQKNAGKYANQAGAFSHPQIAPTYVYHFLIGLHEAAKKGDVFDWAPVLRLAREVIERDDALWFSMQDILETSPASVRGAVADLLTAGCSITAAAIPKELLPDVRRILLQLSHDPDPSAEEELKQTDVDFVTLSINHVRGKALHAIFVYARYRMKMLGLEKANRKIEPEIFDLFEEKLDKTRDAALSVHSVFGWNLPLLYFFDAEWVTAHLSEFFPSDFQMKRYRNVAWDAYISFNNLYSDIFALLFSEYRYAVKDLGATREQKGGLDNANSRLAEHLMLAYLYGFSNAKIDEPLLADFFTLASEETRAHAVWFLWQALENANATKDSEEWMRLKTMWEWRIQKATEVKPSPSKELSTFAYCLRVAPEELNNLASMIGRMIPYLSQGGFADEIVEFLKRNAAQYPKLAVDLLSQVLVNTPESSYLAREAMLTVLTTALNSNDESAKEIALGLINDLGAKGDYDLLKLLNE